MINKANPEERKNIDDPAQMSDVWTYYFEGLKFKGKEKINNSTYDMILPIKKLNIVRICQNEDELLEIIKDYKKDVH